MHLGCCNLRACAPFSGFAQRRFVGKNTAEDRPTTAAEARFVRSEVLSRSSGHTDLQNPGTAPEGEKSTHGETEASSAGLAMVKYIYGQPKEQSPGRDKRRKWPDWEI